MEDARTARLFDEHQTVIKTVDAGFKDRIVPERVGVSLRGLPDCRGLSDMYPSLAVAATLDVKPEQIGFFLRRPQEDHGVPVAIRVEFGYPGHCMHKHEGGQEQKE